MTEFVSEQGNLFYYTLLAGFTGFTGGLLLLAMNLWAHAFVQSYGLLAWQPALAVHILSWYMQIHPGHGVFEGRKPALMDSFVQSLVTAPLFVWFEVLSLVVLLSRLLLSLRLNSRWVSYSAPVALTDAILSRFPQITQGASASGCRQGHCRIPAIAKGQAVK
jgi:uncharacterized membrane protein YGL010W